VAVLQASAKKTGSCYGGLRKTANRTDVLIRQIGRVLRYSAGLLPTNLGVGGRHVKLSAYRGVIQDGIVLGERRLN
jgi:hypothetical protein